MALEFQERPGIIARYGLAVLAVAAIVAIRFILDPWLEGRSQYLLFGIILILISHYLGRGPGFLAIFLGGLVGWYMFVLPRFSFTQRNLSDFVQLVVYLVMGIGITLLGDHLRQVHASLKSALDTANALRRDLERSLEEHSKLDEQLAQQTSQLLRSNRELQQFASVVSHDLQEPLRTITAFTQLLLDRNLEKLDADSKQAAQFVLDGTNRMRTLIRDVLDYASIRNAQVGLPRRVDMNAVADRAVNTLAAAVNASGAKITVDPLPSVLGNERWLTRVLSNLISNAIKYRRAEPPEIHISAQRDGDRWVFSVRDNGIGFKMEYAEKIFEIFQRLHSSDEFEGTGVGLAIVKHLIELHAGEVWAESQPGVGSTFYFSLPASCETESTQKSDI